MIESIERIFAILFLVAVLATAIVGTINPKQGSFLWRLVHMLNYISARNPHGMVTIHWDEYRRLIRDSKQRKPEAKDEMDDTPDISDNP